MSILGTIGMGIANDKAIPISGQPAGVVDKRHVNVRAIVEHRHVYRIGPRCVPTAHIVADPVRDLGVRRDVGQ
eukprot:scaffold12204_cov61-Phaeocystis_antarctica.AAC.7